MIDLNDQNYIRFNDYQLQAHSTAKYPSQHSLAYLALGLGEAGEIQNKIKKILRDHDGLITNDLSLEVMKELGDLLWYIAELAGKLGFTLGAVAINNLNKLEDRAKRNVIQGSGDNR